MLLWFDRGGPFIEDDQYPEPDDYFEYLNWEVTYSGLGEAARRLKANHQATTFSFSGIQEFETSPLKVDHGLREARLGSYCIPNVWAVSDLEASALLAAPPITSWKSLIEGARQRFQHLIIPDAVYQHHMLAREPFESVIRDRALALMSILDSYVAGRTAEGAESESSAEIIRNFFVGERALFTGESPTNQNEFRKALTFKDPDDDRKDIFGHWHGKIAYRYYRLHFEWPLSADAKKLKILYLGPKITKG